MSQTYGDSAMYLIGQSSEQNALRYGETITMSFEQYLWCKCVNQCDESKHAHNIYISFPPFVFQVVHPLQSGSDVLKKRDLVQEKGLTVL